MSKSKLLVAGPSRTTSEVQVDCGNNTDTNHQCSANASAGLESNALKHLREPEGTDEAPNLAYEGDEDTDTGSFFLMTIDSVGDKHGGDGTVEQIESFVDVEGSR